MISKLHIENYILIDSLDIDFESSLNTVTGETGAGKSILLGAIALLLGGRGDASLIKKGAKNLIIEAEFQIDSIKDIITPFFDAEDIDYTSEIVIRRVISESGKSKNYLNEMPVTQAFLKEIAFFLVDIHSQHQTLLLSNQSFQTNIVDGVASTKSKVASYKQIFSEIKLLKNQIKDLKEENERAKRDRDYIQYQYDQLFDANLSEDEKEELEAERDILANAATIGDALYKSNVLLYDGDENVINSLQSVNSAISKIGSYLPNGEELVERLNSVLIEVKDINSEFENLASNIEDNPQRLLEVETRLDILNSLEQKHNVSSVNELIELRESFSSKLVTLDSIDEELIGLESRVAKLETLGWEKALIIRKLRCGYADKLASSIVKNLNKLGMPNATIKVDIAPRESLGEDGADNITFLFSANDVTSLEKIDKVASGGEMSRLMLSLKAISSEGGAMPTIIFDEIDTGVSGKVADQMGNIIEKLAQNIQIINITHLPQVACKGDHHFYVYKEHNDGQSRSHIMKLSEEQRIKEIAVMLSGSNLTDAALAQAKMLLKK